MITKPQFIDPERLCKEKFLWGCMNLYGRRKRIDLISKFVTGGKGSRGSGGRGDGAERERVCV